MCDSEARKGNLTEDREAARLKASRSSKQRKDTDPVVAWVENGIGYALFALVGIAGEDDLDAPDLHVGEPDDARGTHAVSHHRTRPNGGDGQLSARPRKAPTPAAIAIAPAPPPLPSVNIDMRSTAGSRFDFGLFTCRRRLLRAELFGGGQIACSNLSVGTPKIVFFLDALLDKRWWIVAASVVGLDRIVL